MLGLCLKPEIWCKKKERKSSFESYASQYHVLDTVSGATFFQKKYILIKEVCKFKAKAKIICLKFFILILFKLLTWHTMNYFSFYWYLELIWLAKMLKNLMLAKKILGLNWESFWLYGWYVKPYIGHKRNTGIYIGCYYIKSSYISIFMLKI